MTSSIIEQFGTLERVHELTIKECIRLRAEVEAYKAMLSAVDYVQFHSAAIAPVLNGTNRGKWYVEDGYEVYYDSALEAFAARVQ